MRGTGGPGPGANKSRRHGYWQTGHGMAAFGTVTVTCAGAREHCRLPFSFRWPLDRFRTRSPLLGTTSADVQFTLGSQTVTGSSPA